MEGLSESYAEFWREGVRIERASRSFAEFCLEGPLTDRPSPSLAEFFREGPPLTESVSVVFPEFCRDGPGLLWEGPRTKRGLVSLPKCALEGSLTNNVSLSLPELFRSGRLLEG